MDNNDLILNSYIEKKDLYLKAQNIVKDILDSAFHENSLYIAAFESRVKDVDSLKEKLDRKGGKYKSVEDITDLLGFRIVTFYENEVDKVSALVCNLFCIDWDNSVDKRTILNSDQFGYLSIHLVCSIPESLYKDEALPELNNIRFEIQIRTVLQHLWATTMHDSGYKNDVDIPRQYVREMNRLAGLLELVDENFSNLMTNITNYKRNVSDLIKHGDFQNLELNGDTFSSYLKLNPFDDLVNSIAAVNRAEVVNQDGSKFLPILKKIGFETLGDLSRLKDNYFNDARKLGMAQIGETDYDIISSNIGLRYLLIVYSLKNEDIIPLKDMMIHLGTKPERASSAAETLKERAKLLNII